MLGASRTVRDGRTVAHEFVRIGPAGDGVLTYHAHPSGQAPAAFRLARLEPRLAVFENAAHDFPQRIGYRRLADDTLLAWIEGEQRGTPRRLEFPMRRTPCPGGAAPRVARRDEDA